MAPKMLASVQTMSFLSLHYLLGEDKSFRDEVLEE